MQVSGIPEKDVPDALAALEKAGWKVEPFVRFGANALISAQFNAGIDSKKYFWSQLEKETKTAKTWDVDGSFSYGVQKWGANFDDMLDTPTINIPADSVDKAKKLGFSYEERFITTLMRRKCSPQEALDTFGKIGGSLIGLPFAPFPIANAPVINNGTNQVYEAVGQYTWGFDINSDFQVKLINPVWKRFK
jgi:hypothetical protein